MEPKKGIPEERKMFSNMDLKNLIVPLFLEQLLAVLVGIVDTFIVRYAGGAAVPGVSLVNFYGSIFIYLIPAVASTGATMINEYTHRGVRE